MNRESFFAIVAPVLLVVLVRDIRLPFKIAFSPNPSVA
jgi:hypothetical protein